MKKIAWCLFLLLLYLLVFPADALSGARAGLLLWYRSVLPVLFPFMLVCSLLIRFNLLDRALTVLARPFHSVFGCSRYGAFAILTGFLCGFPMGAKVTSDLLRQGRISRQEARVLYGFVNNLSPSFILSFIAADQMCLPSWGGLFLLNILGPALLYGLLSSRPLRRGRTSNPEHTFHRENTSGNEHTLRHGYTPDQEPTPLCQNTPGHGRTPEHEHTPYHGHTPRRKHRLCQETTAQETAGASGQPADLQSTFRVIDDCIYDTILNAVRLGAYIVMFSIACSAASHLLPAGNPVLLFLTSCIEVSNGVHLIAEAPLPLYARYVMLTALGAFGGLSALAQSISIASMDRELSVHYIKSRVKITLLAVLLSLGSVLFVRLFLLR